MITIGNNKDSDNFDNLLRVVIKTKLIRVVTSNNDDSVLVIAVILFFNSPEY